MLIPHGHNSAKICVPNSLDGSSDHDTFIQEIDSTGLTRDVVGIHVGNTMSW